MQLADILYIQLISAIARNASGGAKQTTFELEVVMNLRTTVAATILTVSAQFLASPLALAADGPGPGTRGDGPGWMVLYFDYSSARAPTSSRHPTSRATGGCRTPFPYRYTSCTPPISQSQ